MKIELLEITPNSEKVIEQAARTCYDSGDKIAEGTAADLIKKLIKMGHLSPLEHAYATFKISGVSRAMTHQLVRHRLMSFSQRSQRYVREWEFEYVTPPLIDREKAWLHPIFEETMKFLQSQYDILIKMGAASEDARYILPNACCTEIVVSANFRQWRHVFDMRLTPHAQWEIREVCKGIRDILKDNSPTCFEDYT